MDKLKTLRKKPINLFSFLKPYTKLIFILLFLAFFANGLSLFVPRIIGQSIDKYNQNGVFEPNNILLELGLISIFVLIFSILQGVASSYTAEKISYDLRQKIVKKLAQQDYGYIAKITPARLLTNLTSDIEAVKSIVTQVIVSAFAAILTLIGITIFLLIINWRLALLSLTIIPLIMLAFYLIFRKIGVLFRKRQENVDTINKVINESIIGSTLVRVLNSQKSEIDKFSKVSLVNRNLGLQTVNLFSSLIPVINLLYNFATLLVLYFGGKQVASGSLSVGEFSAFFSYLGLFITPIFILGFISNVFARSIISLGRIEEVLNSITEPAVGTNVKKINGKIEFKNVTLNYNNRSVLKNISFVIQPKTKTAILGPTASGKTQIFSLISGLVKADSGSILIDDLPLENYDQESLYSQLGLVFQDSIIFNTSLRENIQFRNVEDQKTLETAIATANLKDLIDSMPNGLETEISERGGNLSGGQKQRLMLARSLAINPKILLLDDFTARVDIATEKQILSDLEKNYPDLTLISITQKIEPIKDYDQIIVLMEGDLLATGKHQELLEKSFEYKQIYESQQNTDDD